MSETKPHHDEASMNAFLNTTVNVGKSFSSFMDNYQPWMATFKHSQYFSLLEKAISNQDLKVLQVIHKDGCDIHQFMLGGGWYDDVEMNALSMSFYYLVDDMIVRTVKMRYNEANELSSIDDYLNPLITKFSPMFQFLMKQGVDPFNFKDVEKDLQKADQKLREEFMNTDFMKEVRAYVDSWDNPPDVKVAERQ